MRRDLLRRWLVGHRHEDDSGCVPRLKQRFSLGLWTLWFNFCEISACIRHRPLFNNQRGGFGVTKYAITLTRTAQIYQTHIQTSFVLASTWTDLINVAMLGTTRATYKQLVSRMRPVFLHSLTFRMHVFSIDQACITQNVSRECCLLCCNVTLFPIWSRFSSLPEAEGGFHPIVLMSQRIPVYCHRYWNNLEVVRIFSYAILGESTRTWDHKV